MIVLCVNIIFGNYSRLKFATGKKVKIYILFCVKRSYKSADGEGRDCREDNITNGKESKMSKWNAKRTSQNRTLSQKNSVYHP